MHEKCVECEKDITPNDSNEAGVCVDCQEYDYYHQETLPLEEDLTLYQATFEQQDGERRYSFYFYVLAPSDKAAGKFFQEQLEDWFGEEETSPVNDDGWVEGFGGEVSARLYSYGEYTGWYVGSTEGKTFKVNVDIEPLT